MSEQLLLVLSQTQQEIEAEVLIVVERVVFVRWRFAVHDDGRKNARGQLAIGEIEIAIAALPAGFVLDGLAVARETQACLVREYIV